MKKELELEDPEVNIQLAKSNIQENTKLENARPRWNTWILVLKNHVHPQQADLITV